ncbi:MAG: hypothetical protein ACJAXD_001416, partial [Cryomorphaceae bacterium]
MLVVTGFAVDISAQNIYTQNRKEAFQYMQKAELAKRGGNFNNAFQEYTNAITVDPNYA